MELLNKILNKIRKVFGFIPLKKQQLLSNGYDNKEETLQETIKTIDENVNIFDNAVENARDKEEIFRMYKAYKDGKIKEEHLLISDLIDIQLLMLEEIKLIERQIALTNEKNETAKIQLDALLKKKADLIKKV